MLISPNLKGRLLNGVRYYKVPDEEEFLKLVSITSITSHFNKEIFINWRKRVGTEEADRITKRATSRGTDMHTLVEHHLKNEDLPKVQPISDFLFKISKEKLKNINNIHALEGSLYSKHLGIAGTVDCIAEYDGELAIIDFKTSAKPKPREWIEHYFVQCMAYGCMLYELTGISVKKLVIIMKLVKMENASSMKSETNQSTSNSSANTLENLLEISWNSMEPNKELEKVIESKFLTPSKFALEIEKIVAEDNLNYIDAICYYCEINELEVDSITKLISKPLKERLKYDAINLNFMKKTSRAKLPL